MPNQLIDRETQLEKPTKKVFFDPQTGEYIRTWHDQHGNALESVPITNLRGKIRELISQLEKNGANAPRIDLRANIVSASGVIEQSIFVPAVDSDPRGRNPANKRANFIEFAVATARVTLGVTARHRKPKTPHILTELASEPIMQIILYIVSLWLLDNCKRFPGVVLPVPVKCGDVSLTHVPKLKPRNSNEPISPDLGPKSGAMI